jgi:hypothetical protein
MTIIRRAVEAANSGSVFILLLFGFVGFKGDVVTPNEKEISEGYRERASIEVEVY